MALARKCDRCGTFHAGRTNELTTTDIDYDEHQYDLCDECFEEFVNFMNGVKPKDLLGRLQALLKKE